MIGAGRTIRRRHTKLLRRATTARNAAVRMANSGSPGAWDRAREEEYYKVVAAVEEAFRDRPKVIIHGYWEAKLAGSHGPDHKCRRTPWNTAP